MCALMQSSAGAAASQLSLRDIYDLLLDREVARSLQRFAESDRIRDHLSRFGISIDDGTRRWRSRDGRRGRRPNVDDPRWDAAAAQEPVPRADRIAAALEGAAREGVWTTDRFVWNLLRDRELARRAYDYREADRIRSYLQELGFQVDDKTCTWSSADGRTGRSPNHFDQYWWGAERDAADREWPEAAPVVQRPPQPACPPPANPDDAQSTAASGAAAAPAAAVLEGPIALGAALGAGAAQGTIAQHAPASPGQAPQHPAPGGAGETPVSPSVAGPSRGPAGTAWWTQPIPGPTREYLEAHRLRALEEEAAYMARYTWAAAGAGAAAHVTPRGTAAGGAAEPSLVLPSVTPGPVLASPDASPALGVEAEGAVESAQGTGGPDRMAKAHTDRQALIQSLFQILDCDGDGVLSVEELFGFALAVVHIAPHISLPPNVDSSASPGWLEVCRDMAAAHAGHANGFDRAAFGRIVTLGPGQNAGGMALSSRALADLIVYLEAPSASGGAASPVDAPPPLAPPAPPVEVAQPQGALAQPLEPPGPRGYAARATAAEPPPEDGGPLARGAPPQSAAAPALVLPAPHEHVAGDVAAEASPIGGVPARPRLVRFEEAASIRHVAADELGHSRPGSAHGHEPCPIAAAAAAAIIEERLAAVAAAPHVPVMYEYGADTVDINGPRPFPPADAHWATHAPELPLGGGNLAMFPRMWVSPTLAALLSTAVVPPSERTQLPTRVQGHGPSRGCAGTCALRGSRTRGGWRGGGGSCAHPWRGAALDTRLRFRSRGRWRGGRSGCAHLWRLGGRPPRGSTAARRRRGACCR